MVGRHCFHLHAQETLTVRKGVPAPAVVRRKVGSHAYRVGAGDRRRRRRGAAEGEEEAMSGHPGPLPRGSGHTAARRPPWSSAPLIRPWNRQEKPPGHPRRGCRHDQVVCVVDPTTKVWNRRWVAAWKCAGECRWWRMQRASASSPPILFICVWFSRWNLVLSFLCVKPFLLFDIVICVWLGIIFFWCGPQFLTRGAILFFSIKYKIMY